MAIPKEPRQQMINIMYLVLTALLALNVSAEVINAFKKMNRSLEGNTFTLKTKIDDSYKAFKAKIEKNKGRGQEHFDKAQLASVYSDSIIDVLDRMKTDFIASSGGTMLDKDGNDTGEMKAADNQAATTKFFIKGDSLPAQGLVLKEIISSSRNKFLSFFDDNEEDKSQLDLIMPLKLDTVGFDKVKGDGDKWVQKSFFHMPAIAALTEITRYQNEIRSAESMVVEKFSDRVGEKRLNFDKFEAAVIPNAKKFITGDPLELDIFLSASSSSSKPVITVNGSTQTTKANGRASYKVNTSGTGKKTVDIVVKSKNQFGEWKSYPTKFEYEVVPPFRQEYVAVVAPTKMNAFYIGVDNPVQCSISGIPSSKVQASISGGGGTMTPAGNGAYTVRVTSPGKANITVSGPKQEREGGTFSDQREFRVMRIPDPVPEVGGKNGGGLKTGEFKAQRGMIAVLENFLFDARYEIVGFEATLAKKRQDLETAVNAGGTFNSQVKGMMGKVAPGDAFFFDKIKAKGPDGTTRNLGSIAFKIL